MTHQIYNSDFENIKQEIISFISSDPTFSGYNFDGSAIQFIMKLFSYIEQRNNFRLNYASNELFSNTVTQTKNIYKKAKQLNYIPKRKSAPYLEAEFTSTIDQTIPTFSQFEMGETSLVLFDNVSLVDATNSRIATNRVYQGELITESFIVDSTDFFSFDLSTTQNEVDDQLLYVFVDQIQENETFLIGSIPWENMSTEILEPNVNGYYINYDGTNLTIKFDNGRLLNVPQVGDRVVVKYLKTNGTQFNGFSDDITTDIPNLTVSNQGNVLINGTNEESLTEIKNRMQLFNSTQGRAVTERDWNVLVKKYSKYDIFKDVSIWGGEKEFTSTLLGNVLVENSPYKALGRIFHTALKSDLSYPTTEEINDLEDFYDTVKITTIQPVFLHSNITKLTPILSVKFRNILTLDINSIKSQINTYLDQFEGYDTTFYLSNLINFVDSFEEVEYVSGYFATSMTVKDDTYKVIRLSNQVNSNSISGNIGGLELDDDGLGNITLDGANVGTINYSTGFMVINQSLGESQYGFFFTNSDGQKCSVVRETYLKIEDVLIQEL